MRDRLGRELRDLRISVTDRCNLRCTYCMPRTTFAPGHRFLDHRQLLTPEEIERAASAFLTLGVRKIRLTGGEPLLRREIVEIVQRLAALPAEDLALTTNGVLLKRLAGELRDSGLRRITVSLDTVNADLFARISDAKSPLSSVLGGIDAACDAGFFPIKINCVVQRGVNDDDEIIDDLVEYCRARGHILRFIEYMDVGTSNGWRAEEMVAGEELVHRVGLRHPLQPLPVTYSGEVARRYGFRDGGGEIGIVTSVSRPFCQECTRVRLSADGRLYTCLFSEQGTDLAHLLRSGASCADVARTISSVWSDRDDRYSELRGTAAPAGDRVEMSYIGG
ncbi:MAG TPA: GTP 3',8-cyclase MoaA [Candidatus Sulfotelmatobacter sp.]|nr:GTP 3',8-cyclase MoaA [Candidatus Sulfotelmatobacter sp.]